MRIKQTDSTDILSVIHLHNLGNSSIRPNCNLLTLQLYIAGLLIIHIFFHRPQHFGGRGGGGGGGGGDDFNDDYALDENDEEEIEDEESDEEMVVLDPDHVWKLQTLEFS